MKTLFTAMICLTALGYTNAQNSGNANYGNNHFYVSQATTFETTASSSDEMVITIRGIYNEKATAYIAVFSALQLGKTATEATGTMDERIGKVKSELLMYSKDIECITDMISFVPMYNYEVEKKLFSPKTYNEKPSGFELKKNLIIRYKNVNDLDKIIAACAVQEIYDLAKVDYVSTNMDQIRDQLQAKALDEFRQLSSNYSAIMNVDLGKKEKIISEGYNVLYPVENYRSYNAFAAANINFGDKGIVNTAVKTPTQYYNSVVPKAHSFIINADITEPAIQVFYDLTIRIKLKEDQLPKNTIQKNNKYYIITPAGDMKPLMLQ
jgi:uncharacterized protein YggE